jgi:hypothetical protein
MHALCDECRDWAGGLERAWGSPHVDACGMEGEHLVIHLRVQEGRRRPHTGTLDLQPGGRLGIGDSPCKVASLLVLSCP